MGRDGYLEADLDLDDLSPLARETLSIMCGDWLFRKEGPGRLRKILCGTRAGIHKVFFARRMTMTMIWRWIVDGGGAWG